VASGAESGDVVAVDRVEVGALCRAALDAAGASRRVAELLTDAALFAEDRGKAVVGLAHLLDHADAMDDGRLDGRAVPRISRPSAAVTTSNARGGIAHTGFDEGFAGLVEAARRYGVSVFRAARVLHLRTARLAHRTPGCRLVCRSRHRGLPGPARRRTGHRPDLRHQPHGVLRAPRRTPAVHRRPGLQQHRLRLRPGRRREGRPPPRGMGRGRGRPSDDGPRGCPDGRAAALRRLQGREHRSARRAALLDGGWPLGDRHAPVGLRCTVPLHRDVRPRRRPRRTRARLPRSRRAAPRTPGRRRCTATPQPSHRATRSPDRLPGAARGRPRCPLRRRANPTTTASGQERPS
jgi:hypothetical protein